jgi:outer membrane immunogenic protein
MRQHLLVTVSSLAFAGSALAADPPRPPVKAPVAEIAPSWTGPYVGVNGGIAWHRAHLQYTQLAPFFTAPFDFTDRGATLGAQVGYNWQWQKLVTGVEADINWVNGDHSINQQGVFFSSSLDRVSTVRARIGVTLSPTIAYVTGGWAFGKIANVSVIGPRTFSESGTRSGWTAGGGFEHILTKNWTVKAEVLYFDFGDRTVTLGGYRSQFKSTAIIGRLGLNLRW